jgi:methionyl-tRNA formyltransferase
MRVSVLCTDRGHPVWPALEGWRRRRLARHEIELVADKSELNGGQLLFLISCSQIVRAPERAKYAKTLVVHASALPEGRGWSPLVWQILEGRDHVTVSLLEAEDKVDSGDIWRQVEIEISKDALFDEISAQLFAATLDLMDYAVDEFENARPRPQIGAASYYAKRSPSDSALDTSKTIAEQFDLMRVCDPDRYPAFFDLHGHRYFVRLEKSR